MSTVLAAVGGNVGVCVGRVGDLVGALLGGYGDSTQKANRSCPITSSTVSYRGDTLCMVAGNILLHNNIAYKPPTNRPCVSIGEYSTVHTYKCQQDKSRFHDLLTALNILHNQSTRHHPYRDFEGLTELRILSNQINHLHLYREDID